MTVFKRGILDFSAFLLIITVSWTSHGDISSMLVFALLFVDLVELFLVFVVLLLVAFLFSLLFIRLEFVPFVSLESVTLPLLILLLREFLLFMEFDFARVEASFCLFSIKPNTGSLLADVWDCFLPTLDIDRVTGWLFANEVSILFNVDVLESFSELGSKEASGELLSDPVDMGDAGAGAGAAEGGGGTSRRSRNGFLLLFGDENGFVRPIVANFWPEPNGLFGCCVCVDVAQEVCGM